MESSILKLILFLIVLAGSSLIKYLNEKKQKEEETKRQAMPKTRPEDLPEATRRMLYGDTRTPEAQERPAPQQPVVIVARPRQAVDTNEEGPRPVPPRQSVFTPPPLTPTVGPARLPVPPRPMQPSRPVVVQPRPVQRRPVPGPSAAREIMAGAGRLPGRTASPPDGEDGGWMQRDRLERRDRAEQAQTRATAAANTARKQRLFAAGTDLRRAILMNEILGPPVALREPFGPFQNGPNL